MGALKIIAVGFFSTAAILSSTVASITFYMTRMPRSSGFVHWMDNYLVSRGFQVERTIKEDGLVLTKISSKIIDLETVSSKQ